MSVVLSFHTSARHASRPGGKAGPIADPYGFARLLMDGALERIEAARQHLVNGEQPERQSLLHSAVAILNELRADLDLPRGGAIAANLDDLYDYMCRRLGCAACGARAFLQEMPDLQNGIAALDEVSHLLDALHSAWIFMPAEVRKASRN